MFDNDGGGSSYTFTSKTNENFKKRLGIWTPLPRSEQSSLDKVINVNKYSEIHIPADIRLEVLPFRFTVNPDCVLNRAAIALAFNFLLNGI